MASLTGFYLATQSQRSSLLAENNPPADIHNASAGSMTIPVITNGKVDGYFLTKVSLVVEGKNVDPLEVPIEELLRDEMLTLLTGSRYSTLPETGNYDIAAFKTMVKDAMNKRLGAEAVLQVLVGQLDYLSKKDLAAINDPNAKGGKPVAIVDKNGRVANDRIPESK